MQTASLSEIVIALQREVQRKLGRSLLRLQQCEKLIKFLVAEQSIASNVNDFHNARKSQHETVAKKSMGQTVGVLCGNFIAPTIKASVNEDNDEAMCDPMQPWIKMSFRIEFSADDFKRTQQRLADLVVLRNELVHHFLDKYDLWSEPGCLAADTYLDECYQQIDAHCLELQQWAKGRVNASALLSNYMNTREFIDCFIHGIMPGKAGVHWDYSPIVNLLRDAEVALADEGWTLLANAIAYIGKREAEQTPKKYGCSSWRHVLHESKQFEIRKVQVAPEMPTETWYRSRPCSATLGEATGIQRNSFK